MAAVLFNAAVITGLFGRFLYTPDTPCYVSTARLLVHLPRGRACDFRILKPLPLILPGLLERATGLEAQYGFLVQNLLFYCMASLLIFEIIRIVFGQERQAFWGTLLFISAPPLVLHGLAYLTDMPGWFFGILGMYLTLRAGDTILSRRHHAVLIGCVSGLGFLWKESAIVGVLFFALHTFLVRLPWREKLLACAYSAFGFMAPVLISSAIVYSRLEITFWSWYEFNRSMPYGDYYRISNFVREILRTLYVPWLLFLVGLGRLTGDYLREDISMDRMRFLVASGGTLLLWPIWPTPLSRIFYLSSPFLAAVASYGVGAFAKNRQTVLVLIAALFNYVVVGFWIAFAIRGLVYVLGVLYVTLMACCWYFRGAPERAAS